MTNTEIHTGAGEQEVNMFTYFAALVHSGSQSERAYWQQVWNPYVHSESMHIVIVESFYL
jgi:hypothetical protein